MNAIAKTRDAAQWHSACLVPSPHKIKNEGESWHSMVLQGQENPWLMYQAGTVSRGHPSCWWQLVKPACTHGG